MSKEIMQESTQIVECNALLRHWYQQTARDHQRGPVQIRPLGGQ